MMVFVEFRVRILANKGYGAREITDLILFFLLIITLPTEDCAVELIIIHIFCTIAL
jgi:hypothetical protein